MIRHRHHYVDAPVSALRYDDVIRFRGRALHVLFVPHKVVRGASERYQVIVEGRGAAWRAIELPVDGTVSRCAAA